MSHKANELTNAVVATAPTAGEKAALAGTDGAPGAGNPYVTDSDARNTNARTPTAHAASHQNAGGDEVATAVAGANAIPKAGAGGTLAVGWNLTQIREKTAEWLKDADDAAAADATSERPFHRFNSAGVISAVHYTPDANAVGNDTNNATIKVWARDLNGATQQSIASFQTTATPDNSLTQFKPTNLGTILNGTRAAGDVLLVEITKANAGVVIPKGVLTVVYTVS